MSRDTLKPGFDFVSLPAATLGGLGTLLGRKTVRKVSAPGALTLTVCQFRGHGRAPGCHRAYSGPSASGTRSAYRGEAAASQSQTRDKLRAMHQRYYSLVRERTGSRGKRRASLHRGYSRMYSLKERISSFISLRADLSAGTPTWRRGVGHLHRERAHGGGVLSVKESQLIVDGRAWGRVDQVPQRDGGFAQDPGRHVLIFISLLIFVFIFVHRVIYFLVTSITIIIFKLTFSLLFPF